MSKRGRNLNKPKVNPKQRRKNAALSKLWDRVKKSWELRDLPKCLDLLAQMEKLDPGNPRIHLELGRIQGRLQDYDTAEQRFDRAIELAPGKERSRLLAEAGMMARDFYEPDLAEKYFVEALECEDVEPSAFVDFAGFSERKSPELAREIIDRALLAEPDYLPAKWMQGHLLRMAGNLDAAEEILRPLIGHDAPPMVRARAGYDLGALLDRAGRYDEAMAAFVLAKSMMFEDGVRLRDQRKKSIDRIKTMREEITPEILRRWHDEGQELQPHRRLALLGGHPRSGTTLLEQVLDAHGGICSAEETTHFLDEVVRPVTPGRQLEIPIVEAWGTATTEQLRSVREAYFAAMEKSVGGSIGERLLVDKNPSLTLSPAVLSRSFPEMKFLIALRDPRDVVMSCFMQPMFPIQQVNATWLQLESTIEEYTNLMGSWRDLEPMLPNPSLTVRYEDMVADLEPVARKCLEFFEAPWDDRVLDYHKHASEKIVRSPTYAEVTKKIFTSSRGRWRNYQKFLEPHLSKLEPYVKSFGYE